MWDLTWDSEWDNTGKDNLGTCAGVGSPSPADIHHVDQKWGLQTEQPKNVHGCLIFISIDQLVAQNKNNDISTAKTPIGMQTIFAGVC